MRQRSDKTEVLNCEHGIVGPCPECECIRFAEARAELERRAQRAYADCENVLQRFIAKQNHRSMTVYDAVDLMIRDIRLLALAAAHAPDRTSPP